jgi:hypothetical protein
MVASDDTRHALVQDKQETSIQVADECRAIKWEDMVCALPSVFSSCCQGAARQPGEGENYQGDMEVRP